MGTNTTEDHWVRPDLIDIMIDRYQVLSRCDYENDFRLLTLDRCRRDPLFWCDTFVFTSDPRNASRGKPVTIPFILYPRQREYLLWRRERLANREWGVMAKSRDSGASWLNVADQVHHWLFDRDYKGAFGSRKAMLVDRKGDPDSIFQKIRFLIYALPHWMMPPKDRMFDGYMKLINDLNGSVITGEAGDNIGRGGRNLLYDWDEAAFTPHQESVIAALSQNTDTCIRTSTPNGLGDAFSTDYNSGNFSTFTFHWKEDPRKNYWEFGSSSGFGRDAPDGSIFPWYEDQKKKLDPLKIAREIDINFAASMEGIVIRPEWVEAAIGYEILLTSYNKQAGLDVATESGNDETVFIEVDDGCKVSLIDAWKGLDITNSAFRARDICRSRNTPILYFDGDGVGSGIGSTLANDEYSRWLSYRVIHGASKPSDLFWQGENKSSAQKFANRRGELWWLTREKFRKTYEVRNGINSYPKDELISIPNNPKLITQLSQPTYRFNSVGKILIESKEDMKKRGIKSPDYADALVYSLAKDTNFEFRNTGVSYG